ncbi:MAG: quinolinate phosphoribosyl transferase, nicotinate phosphoribosyltransferase [Candidatus Gottesmanbacteria bacterium GW2011_GWA2_43_14]|uniref:nicotinate phosphoribosyltransferase n=1 Tax=Candidatus Gottesmanbacteria bacterium GW2011_GWA2_43_14 TaxID=1618443 RepID=A0A0G1GG14_9BACT|nr:MAG: quinolinate phosphoribosyl transferase, nicotinate phosphoribosyltransferase [Candidatus Gottesmanbacteria bacterium GW2011_GWA2_43_14]
MKYFDSETITKIRQGYYTAVYFNRTKEILLKVNNLKRVTMQIFQKKKGSILSGVEEVRELMESATGFFKGSSWIDKSPELKVSTLNDGDDISAWETVMHLMGPYVYFAHLESIYLGILARRTLVATNTRRAVEAAGGKPVIFFADRFDHFLNQEGDGAAAKIGGASAICTDAMTKWAGGEPAGTIPHALIAVLGGSTVKSAELFNKYYPGEKLIALVDFNNDCVTDSLAVSGRLGDKLWAVRLDTPADIADKSLEQKKDNFGVNPSLVRAVREALDKAGFAKVKIIVSGGFYPEKIAKFTAEKVPVDGYGVGSALIHGENDFTADIVEVEGQKKAKIGREYKDIRKIFR